MCNTARTLRASPRLGTSATLPSYSTSVVEGSKNIPRNIPVRTRTRKQNSATSPRRNESSAGNALPRNVWRSPVRAACRASRRRLCAGRYRLGADWPLESPVATRTPSLVIVIGSCGSARPGGPPLLPPPPDVELAEVTRADERRSVLVRHHAAGVGTDLRVRGVARHRVFQVVAAVGVLRVRTSSVGASSMPGRGSGNTVMCSPSESRPSVMRSPSPSTRWMPSEYTGPV